MSVTFELYSQKDITDLIIDIRESKNDLTRTFGFSDAKNKLVEKNIERIYDCALSQSRIIKDDNRSKGGLWLYISYTYHLDLAETLYTAKNNALDNIDDCEVDYVVFDLDQKFVESYVRQIFGSLLPQIDFVDDVMSDLKTTGRIRSTLVRRV